MKLLTTLLATTLLFTGAGCVTKDSDTDPQPIRPQGSGGRGDSPGYHSETSSAVSKPDRMGR